MAAHDPQLPDCFAREVPRGDTRERSVCSSCGFIDYENPKIVAGLLCLWEGKVLLCRRAIEPRRGFWTLPAGYLELGETPEQGACREAWEEARAEVDLEQLFAIYTVQRISQVQLFYRARLRHPRVAAGPESLEVRLFDEGDYPWQELAFPTVHWALRHHLELTAKGPAGQAAFAPFSNPPGATGAYEELERLERR